MDEHILAHSSGPNSARSSGPRSGRLSADGKLPVFSSRAPGSARASREASPRHISPIPHGCVGDATVVSTKIDYLISMETTREARAKERDEGFVDISLPIESGTAAFRGERSFRAIRLSKDPVTDPSDAPPVDVGALQQLWHNDQHRRQQRKDRKTLVPLRDPMRGQVPTPRATPRSANKVQNDAAGGGGGGGNGDDGNSSARRARQGSMAWINQV